MQWWVKWWVVNSEQLVVRWIARELTFVGVARGRGRDELGEVGLHTVPRANRTEERNHVLVAVAVGVVERTASPPVTAIEPRATRYEQLGDLDVRVVVERSAVQNVCSKVGPALQRRNYLTSTLPSEDAT